MTADSVLRRGIHWGALAVIGVLGAWAVSLIVAGSLPRSAGAEARAADPVPASAPVCDGDGRSGRRVEAIYVRGQSGEDRFGALAPRLADVLARTDAALGGGGHIRFVHDAKCVPSVANVIVPEADLGDFSRLTAALSSLGFGRSDRAYVLWHEGGGCGMTSGGSGTGGSTANPGATPGPVYAALGTSCWNWHATAQQLSRVLTPDFLVKPAH
ncbi:MAG: hypothetical protein JWO79_3834 [Actinomycetia bacterium]|nr:hypothetical protein [Actinomycetes bacterium]MDQ1654986.1 hypothetical protein [Cryptosporangiaceae bacterium]